MTNIQCYIWNTPAEDCTEENFDGKRINSPRAGGIYRITRSVIKSLEQLDIQQKKAVTSWIVEQHRSGIEGPLIDTYNLEKISARRPLTFSEKINNALRFFDRQSNSLQQFVQFGGRATPNTYGILAECELNDGREATNFFHRLKEMGYLEGEMYADGPQLRLSNTGLLRLEETQRQSPDSTQAFIAMWFDPKMNEAWEHLEKAIIDSGYKAIRIDKKEHANKIDDEIIAEIRRSKFLVADFTCDPRNPRGGVYYEAGFAQGLGLRVIWTAHKDSINDVHFDTRQYNHILWETPDELYNALKNRIGAVIGDGPLKR